MKFSHIHPLRFLTRSLVATSVALTAMSAFAEKVAIDAIEEVEAKKSDTEKKESTPSPTKPKKLKAKLHLTNGDKLSGLPQSVDEEQRLLFKSESLRQTANFPLDNVLSISLDNWQQQPTAKTIAKIQLFPRFREASGDTVLGELIKLTADSIKINTWYGGEVSLKRSMVQSLKIISNSPGNYYGPNNLQEWTMPDDNDSWEFRNGALISEGAGSIGRDIKLRDKSHISFKAVWKSSMRFKFRLYSSDISDSSPDAYYEVNINRSYAYMRTRGSSNNRNRFLGGGRWKQITARPEGNSAQFDVFVNRTSGSISVYINGQRACMLQSQNPNPRNLGTGLSFLAEERYPLEVSAITVTPWNGTTLPKPKVAIKRDDKEKEQDDKAPHRIILNNGDEVPGQIGEIKDNRLIVETKYTPIRIPLDRIKSFNLGGFGEEPKKYREDIRAWFHSGGHVTLKLTSFKDGKIAGFSQALGDVSFNLSAFSRIDFHIYDQKANETRKKIRY